MTSLSADELVATADSRERARILTRLLPLFATSGIAALMYQICWQRQLFVAFGVDVDSVTIIVSTFMMGLGIGALVGGQLADRHPQKLLVLFALTELCIGLFGFASPHLIRAVGSVAIHASLPVIAVTNMLLLLVPTVMMGATLPILVAHVVRTYGSIGESIGLLYFVNTLGAALGAALTGFVVLYYFGLTPTIYIAAIGNLLVAAFVWFGLGGRHV